MTIPQTSYHFPRTNLNQLSAALGDGIAHCEARWYLR